MFFPSQGSIRLGRLFGIEFSIHWMFLFFVGLLTLLSGLSGGPVQAFGTLVFLAALFGCVALHEIGHCLAARHFRIRVHGITLFPLGGVAQMEITGRQPRAEFWIALAGPAVSFLLAFLLTPIAYLGHLSGFLFPLHLLAINLTMALFNLLPAFPLDGGRVLRSHLAARWGNPLRATERAVAIGKRIAIGLGLLGLFFNPWLILLAFFIYSTGEQELRMIRQLTGQSTGEFVPPNGFGSPSSPHVGGAPFSPPHPSRPVTGHGPASKNVRWIFFGKTNGPSDPFRR